MIPLFNRPLVRLMSLDKLFGDFLNSAAGKGALSGAASGALATLLLHPKARKKLGKSAVKLGGAAALAGVGYLAYKKWLESRGGGSMPGPEASMRNPSLPPPPNADTPQLSDDLRLKLVLAMIAAAAADGRIDDSEMDRLVESIENAGLSSEENREITTALENPPTVEQLASLSSNLEESSELYAAALSAIDPDSPAEHLFLKRLARAFGLEPALVASVHEATHTA